MENQRGKYQFWLLILGLITAAAVIIFLAWRLYHLRRQPIAPTAPQRTPAAENAAPQCTLTFVIPTPVPTNTPTPSPAPTATPIVYQETPTLTPTRKILPESGNTTQTVFTVLLGGIATGLAILLAL